MENFDAEDRLNIISDNIVSIKDNIKKQSFYYLLWGWLVIVSSIFNYLLIKIGATKLHFIPWLLIIPIGWITTTIYARNHRSVQGFETQIESFLKYLWIVLGFSMFIVVFISEKVGLNPSVLTLLLAGIGACVSGLTLKFKPLVIGGIALLVFSIVCFFITNENAYLFYAFAMIIGYLLPGYKLRKEKINV